MPNKYIYDCTFDDKREEEDREVRNDMMRSIRDYYDSMFLISRIYYKTLCEMSHDELKQVLMHTDVVKRI